MAQTSARGMQLQLCERHSCGARHVASNITCERSSMTLMQVSVVRILTMFVQGGVTLGNVPSPLWAAIDFLARHVTAPLGLGFPDAYIKQ